MSRILYLMRHGKSSWDEPLPDHERPLKKKGRRKSKLVAKELKRRGWIPQLILSSDAVRAVQTARIVAETLKIDSKSIRYDGGLYAADYEKIVETIRSLPDGTDSVLVIGHNPGISDTATRLGGSGETSWMPTSALARIRVRSRHWKDLDASVCALEALLLPAEVKK